MSDKYKTYEELKEELGDKFEEYMYKANIELLTKIDKAIEDLKNTLKYNMKHKDIRGNEYVDMDIDHIQMLIDMLEEVKENEMV